MRSIFPQARSKTGSEISRRTRRSIIAYCMTGLRAESAYDDLKESGYKTRFLNALIQIDKDGKYEITKK